jgi:hypothetical protein
MSLAPRMLELAALQGNHSRMQKNLQMGLRIEANLTCLARWRKEYLPLSNSPRTAVGNILPFVVGTNARTRK